MRKRISRLAGLVAGIQNLHTDNLGDPGAETWVPAFLPRRARRDTREADRETQSTGAAHVGETAAGGMRTYR